ncbi:glycosyltransferase [Flammeovirga agarivorans]|uniref:Glycosyltransferase n=1 Tax=Flammeovirga agarivorans TaxID=2726742 RepID=A0A7X8SQK8_9BACT|nr:glycosyltransferase [Flammeovirga agarivorans]NLR94587.1 glycosyltransferase [Flammeovirga agarivorans]
MKISVIVPTHNREELVLYLAKSLAEQNYPKEDYEVFIVCDGCIDNTVALLDENYGQLNNWTILSINQSGPAKARNTGAQLANGKILAFTDDDCIADPNWLKAISEAFDSDENLIGIEGLTFTDNKNVTPLTHQIENLNGNPALPTCNAAYLKSTFEELQGFDESFPYAHNEDADFAWRLKEKGKVIFLDSMKIYHPPRMESLSKLKGRMKILESEFPLYYKNPFLYKKYRNTNPWRTIYIEVFLYHQLMFLKHVLGFFRRPKTLSKGLSLVVSWWVNLIVLFPSFLRMDQKYKKQFSS